MSSVVNAVVNESLFAATEANVEDHRFLPLYLFLLFSGCIGVSIIFFTALFSKRVHRHVTWMNFCLTWMISPLFYLILTFAGKNAGPPPSYELCLFQASFIYGSPTMTATSSFCLILHILLSLRDSFKTKPPPETSGYKTETLLAAPFVALTIFTIEAFIIGIKNPDQVRRNDNGFYCVISGGTPGFISAIFVIVFVLATILVEGFILLLLYRNWLAFKSFSHRDQLRIGLATPTMLVRIVVFTLFSESVVGLCFFFLWQSSPLVPNLYLSTIPLAVFLVFGMQRDMMSVWMFWRKDNIPSRDSVSLA